MFKFVFLLLLVLFLANSACRVNAYCMEDLGDCILDEDCCSGYCDWNNSYYPFSGGCAPLPLGPLPPKPCIPLYAPQTCVYNVTCCEGYCETRYSTEGFCIAEPPPGYPPIASPAPIEDAIAPVSAPVGTDLVPSPLLANDLTPSPSPSGVAIPRIHVPIAAPAPAPVPSGKKGAEKKPASPTPSQSIKDKGKNKRVIAPTPAPTKKINRKLKKENGKDKLKCARAHAPSPA